MLFFFLQAEDGIRDYDVTGVQTCALPSSAVMSPHTDGIRKADEDDPRGYWEWESLKQTADLKQLFDETEGLEQRAIKVVSALVPTLPIEHSYRIIFMLRPLEEVARSQARMIERLGTEGAGQIGRAHV